MPTSATIPDATQFLGAMSYNADELKEAKAAIHHSREFRMRIRDALGDMPIDTTGKAALARATALYLLSRPTDGLAALSAAGASPQVVLLRGILALELGDPMTAASAFGSLVGTAMEGGSFLTNLATAAALAGDAAMAQKAAAKLPEGADALYAEGIAMESDGEYGEACRKYTEALARDPKHVRALFRLAHRLDTDGEDERAIATYARCIAIQPTHVNALQNLALLYEDHGRYAEAETCYRRVLSSDRMHVRARVGLKDVLASQNMYYDEDHERREDRRAQVLRTPISEFELSVRSRNCLAKMHISSLGDLVRKSEQELLAYKNFGETSLQEIKDILAQKGLRLGMSQEDDAPLFAPSAQPVEAQLDVLFGAPVSTTGVAPNPSSGSMLETSEPPEIPIEQLDLSIRARRCMENLEIYTVGDLVRHSESELLASKNFGQTSLNEVRRKLDGMGMSLRRK